MFSRLRVLWNGQRIASSGGRVWFLHCCVFWASLDNMLSLLVSALPLSASAGRKWMVRLWRGCLIFLQGFLVEKCQKTRKVLTNKNRSGGINIECTLTKSIVMVRVCASFRGHENYYLLSSASRYLCAHYPYYICLLYTSDAADE